MSNKINKAIEVIYQATGSVAGLDDVKMDIYDEAHAEDVAKAVAAMTEIGSTGRYYGVFTPDAEGEWTVLIDSIVAPGKVVRKYTVVAHDVDSVGDAIAGLNNVAVGDFNNLSAANIATELGTYDAATGTEVAALENVSTTEIAAELETYDAPTKAEVDAKIDALSDITTAQVATELETYDAVKKSELDAVQGGSETLESIKTAVDAVGTPPMVG